MTADNGVKLVGGGPPCEGQHSNAVMMDTKIDCFVEDDDGELRETRRRWDAMEAPDGHCCVVVDSGGERHSAKHVLEIVVEETERSKSGKWFDGAVGEHVKNHAPAGHVSSVRGVRPQGVVSCGHGRPSCVGVSGHPCWQ